jgi:hypothetical protein
MSWVAVAVGGSALVSGYMNNKAQKGATNAQVNAANQQAQSADRAAQVQWDMYNQSRTDNEPFRQAGLTGLQEYMALLGLPTSTVSSAVQTSSQPRAPTEWFGAGNAPTVNAQLYATDPAYRRAWDELDANHRARFKSGYTVQSDRDAIQNDLARLWQQYTPTTTNTTQGAATPGVSMTQEQAFDRFRNTPGYQFGLNEGVRTLDSSAAAAGGLFSGKAAKALTKFGQDYADQQGYRPYMNSLASLAGIGQTATNQNASLGQSAAGGIGNAYIAGGNAAVNAGNARASGLLNNAQNWGNTLGQLAGVGGYMYGNRWGGV